MFDVGFSELVLMAIVALVVLGPEKLPHAARVAGAWVGRIRRTVSNMQAEIEREVSAQEVRERLQKEIEAVRAAGQELDIRAPFQAVADDMHALQGDIRSSLPPATGTGTAVLPVIPDPATEAALLPAESSVSSSAEAAQPAPAGEEAYREWLTSQKNANLRPEPAPADEAKKDTPAP